jgi:DNA-binding transcriptional LysR family regulator
MSFRLTTDDLALVDAVARHSSIGAAARELLTTQPSASRRLVALERRLRVRLFERDTTGARPTVAGRELASRAGLLLTEIDALPEQIAARTGTPSLSIGTIQALAPIVFSSLDLTIPDLVVHPEIEHGPTLIDQVEQGTLDAAIVTIAEQTPMPRELHRIPLGTSPLVFVLPDGCAPIGNGDRPLHGREIVYSSIDLAAEPLQARLSGLGATPRSGPTIEATLHIARRRKIPAVVPELAAHWWGNPTDRLLHAPGPDRITLTLVSRPPAPRILTDAIPELTARILGTSAPDH